MVSIEIPNFPIATQEPMGYLSMDATTTQEPAEAQAKSSRRGRPRAHGKIEVVSAKVSMIPIETK